MSSVKEPYIISVWEEELIPAQDWYVKGENRITAEEYNELTDNDKKEYELYTIMEHYEEVQGVIIGSDNIDSTFGVINPIFKENINGSVELTFSLQYKTYDPDILDFTTNPFIALLSNEAKIKLKFRNNWYDLVVKNCVEDSTNYLFTYTCKDFYINELNKNGFKVELDSELENNQGSVVKLGQIILKDTDWKINEEKSDIIVETKVEPLYFGILKYDIAVERVNDYVPDVNVEINHFEEPIRINKSYKSEKGTVSTSILLFYSDVAERKKQPQILAIFEPNSELGKLPIYKDPSIDEYYILDANDDIIINGYNYRIIGYYDENNIMHDIEYSQSALKDNFMNIIETNGLSIYQRARAEKVVRSQKTGYDPSIDKFISKYYKLDVNGEPDTNMEYYGYSEEKVLRSGLTENYLANSDNFTSTQSGWIFSGVPEKRTKKKEAGYVGQIFQKTVISENNPNSAIEFDETLLEMNLKPKDDDYYYKDTQGQFYLIKERHDKDEQGKDIYKDEYVPVESDRGKSFEGNVFDLYKKYQREGAKGYAEKTDNELNTMVNEYLSSVRYSKGQRVAINTGVAANRDKIKQLSPGEEYVFAVSLGKFKDGEKAPELETSSIDYGVEAPSAYYEFIEVDNSAKFAYNAANEAIDELEEELKKDSMKYYLELADYQKTYSDKYEEVYNDEKEKYKKRYLRTSYVSTEETKENWQPGGRKKENILWGEWIGYYEIFLNVLRGFDKDEGKSEESYRDPTFIKKLHQALKNIKTDTTSDHISKKVYKAFISVTIDSDGNPKYGGLYPEMVRGINEEAEKKQKKQSFIKQEAYKIMGMDNGYYPDYDESGNCLSPKIDSFNEFLFTEFYYGVLYKWMDEGNGSAVWAYDEVDSNALSSLLKSIYKACYENTNTLAESLKYTKEYHLPTTLDPKGGKYYQIHEAEWIKKAKAAAKKAVEDKEAAEKNFIHSFNNEKDKFIKFFCGSYQEGKDNEDNPIYKKDQVNGEDISLADYCYKKEQNWLTTKTETQIQSSDFIKQLKAEREKWVNEYIKESQNINQGYQVGTYYCSSLLDIFYLRWAQQKELGTYTYNTDTYELNVENEGENNGISFYQPSKDSSSNLDIVWTQKNVYTTVKNATHYAVEDETEEEENKQGGYVFDRETEQIRLFDPYLDVLNATFIPEKDDEGAYVFDPFMQRYRPYRDWDSKEYRDPLTLDIDDVNGMPGDKVHHPLKLFDGRFGAWYDTPTRYNMIRKYEDPNNTMINGKTKYCYLTDDTTILENGHYNGKDYQYEITYPKGYQKDVYVKNSRGKYIKEQTFEKQRLFNLKDDFGISFEIEENNFYQIISESATTFLDRLIEPLKKIKEYFNPMQDAYNGTTDQDANKKDAGIATSNTNNSNDIYYDEDAVSINFYGEQWEGEEDSITGIGCCALNEVANSSEIANAIQIGKAKESNEKQTRQNNSQPTERFIKYKPYYWRHWGKQRYDYQPKICIQQTIDGIKTYKPYNNIEDKKSEAYFVYKIERDKNGIATNLPINSEKIIFLKDRKTTYRQRVETDYESQKYRMKKVDSISNNYWIQEPNGENYLRRYKFGDGKIELFDGHLGKWIQCYSAFKVESDGELSEEEKKEYLDGLYMPYDNIMIPYNKRIFGATKAITRISKPYSKEIDHNDIYVSHNNIFISLDQYLKEVGHTSKLSYNNLKVSFVDNYEYDSSYFSISVPQERNSYLEFNLKDNNAQYVDLIVEENIFTSEVTKERWAYWIAPVTKGFSLIENPLSKLGMLFETTEKITEENSGRYIFLGMQLFKYIPYETSLEKIETSQVLSSSSYILNEALKELYENNEQLTNINQFKQKLMKSPDSLVLLNATPYLYKNNYTVLADYTEKEVNLSIVKVITSKNIIPLFPEQAPDAADMHFTNYYIYDPDVIDNSDNIIFDYVGKDYSEKFVPAYDETCQKIRSIKGKESNYFKLLQDCCDTFDCWMQKEIKHDPITGKIEYCDIPVYTEILEQVETEKETKEPQIFIGEKAKLEGTLTAAERIHYKLQKKIKKVGSEPEDFSFQQYCKYEVANGKTLDEKEQKLLIRLNRINNLHFTVEYMRVPDKQIFFKRFVGEEKWNGFKYGVNLKHIKRTIDSSQFSTRVIVKQNNNEFAKDKFCTIARAEENPIKENFILDFSYYINNKLLNNSDLIGDLYTDVNTRLNYYPKLTKLNSERDELITNQSSLSISLANINSKYETLVQMRDAALEEITKLTQILTQNYDSYGQIISVPWKYNKSQEYVQKKQTSTPGTTKIITDKYGEEDYSYEIKIPSITTVVDYPKYNETLRSYLDQMDTYQREYSDSVNLLKQIEPEKKRIEAELAEIQAYLEEIANKKNELHKLFYHKYSRFIQEGSWVEESYIDDNLYYLDALSVSRISAKPKVTYDIGVVDISAAYEYEDDRIVLESNLGDRTYIEDVEFFGYNKDDITKPYWELVIVTEKTYNIADPSQNQVKVKNYTTQFDDLFQRIAATSQTLQFNEGSYARSSSILNKDGTLKSKVLEESISNSDFIIQNSINEKVKIDKTGVTIISEMNRANVVKLVSSGILLSSDGGNSYSVAITGDGINADLLLAGTINTDNLLIGGRSTPNFLWNKLGISAFKTDKNNIDYSSFVRMDQYGIYGIKNYSKDGRDPQRMSINDAFEPLSLKDITENPNAVFGLTWEGFFLNATNGSGKVTIGTGQDFKMSEYSDEQSRWIDRVIIGRLNDNDYYGFQLRNSNNQVVMETGDTGELYLKRKLRISNFGEESTIRTCELVYDGDSIEINEEVYNKLSNEEKDACIEENDKYYIKNYLYKYELNENGNNVINYYSTETNVLLLTEVTNKPLTIKKQSDRVSLGVVDIYDRNNGYIPATIQNNYSSIEYLTKVFSVKANSIYNSEQFNDYIIENIIDKNENFAIFDNGNLFARNAWIEGNINVKSGTLRKLDVYGTLTVGKEQDDKGDIISTGYIQHASNSWSINGDGTAHFNNVDISGKITSAIFEYNKVQTVAGSMLIRPGVPIKSFEEDSENKVLKLFVEKVPAEFTENSKVQIIGDLDDEENIRKYTINKIEETVIYITDYNEKTIKYLEEDDKNKILTHLYDIGSDQKISNSIGIGINATKNTVSGIPGESISLIDFGVGNEGVKYHTVIGRLSENIISHISDGIRPQIKDSFGIYCDNVLLNGTIFSSTDNNIAGLTTQKNFFKEYDNKKGFPVLFAGGEDFSINDLSFYVTNTGYLYAKEGFFAGEIESAIIKTSTIIGSGTDYGLTIKDASKAISFQKTQGEENIEIFNLTDTSACFNNSKGKVFSIFYENDIGIGMFSPEKDGNLSSHLLKFIQEEEAVKIYFKGKPEPVVTISSEGFAIEGQKSLGRNTYIMNAQSKNEKEVVDIGIDIYVS